MRTQKRFTPSVLDRYARIGRGTGSYHGYIPWHRVGRSDPASAGRSHLTNWRNRLRETLSDKELDGLHFSLMLKNLIDVREQFPLQLQEWQHETADYDICHFGKRVSGTLDIAQYLGIKHPLVHGEGRSEPWTMTTDQLLAFSDHGSVELLAIAFKPDSAALTKRNLQLLAIEREYWAVRSVPWLLITPSQYEKSVALTLRRSAPWALSEPVPPTALKIVVEIAYENTERSLAVVIGMIGDKLGGVSIAQNSFWQAVWNGDLPLDLRRGWRPHLPIDVVSQAEFYAFNPIAARRTAWN